MSEAVRRIFVEKKDEFAVEAQGMLADLKENLSLDALQACGLSTAMTLRESATKNICRRAA